MLGLASPAFMRIRVLYILLGLACLAPAQVLVDLKETVAGPSAPQSPGNRVHQPVTVEIRSVRIEMNDAVARTLCELRLTNPNGVALSGRMLLALPPRVIAASAKVRCATQELKTTFQDPEAAATALTDAIRAGASAALLTTRGAPHLIVELPMIAAAADTVLQVEHESAVDAADGRAHHEVQFCANLVPLACRAQVRSTRAIGLFHAGSDEVSAERSAPQRLDLHWTSPSSRLQVSFKPLGDGPQAELECMRDADGSRVFALCLMAPELPAVVSTPRDVILLVDSSGSMRGEHAVLARELIRRLAAGLEARDRMALVSFNGEARVVQALTVADPAGQAQVLHALEQLSSSGGTHLVAGLAAALSVVDPTRKTDIILCTDGPPTVGPTATRSVLAQAQRLNVGQLPIHLALLGAGPDVQLLRMMADAAGGVSERVSSLNALNDAVGRLRVALGPAVMRVEGLDAHESAIDELTLPRRRDLSVGERVLITGRVRSSASTAIRAKVQVQGTPQQLSCALPAHEDLGPSWINSLHTSRWLSQELARWREAEEGLEGRRSIELWAQRQGVSTPFAHSITQRVGKRVFQRRESVWVEAHLATRLPAEDGQRLVRVVEGSTDWCKLLNEAPELAEVLALTAQLLFEHGGRLVQVVAR